MTLAATFYLTIGSYVAAAVVAMLGDAFGGARFWSYAAAALLAAGGALSLAAGWTTSPDILSSRFVVGGGFSTIAGLVGVLSALAVVTEEPELGAREGQRASLVAFVCAGAAIAAASTDLVSVALALETAAAAGYALVALTRTPRSSEAAMKYFVQGAVATGMLLAGIAVLLGGFNASGGYGALATAYATGTLQSMLLGVLLVIAALAFKVGAAPFHSWAPDAYEHAPASASAVLSGPVKVAVLTVLAVFVGTVCRPPAGFSALDGLGASVYPILGGVALLSIVVGSLVALRQRSYTRMLGYAGVAQVGYALIALAAVNPSSGVLFMATYAIASTGAFIAARSVHTIRPAWDGSIEGMQGIGRTHPVLGVAITFLMLSLAGIPPLLGFWGKLQAFRSGVAVAMAFAQQGQEALGLWYAALVAAGVVGSIVSLGYYGAVIRAVYGEAAQGDGGEVEHPVWTSTVLVVLVGVAVLALGLLPLALPLDQVVRGFLM